MFSISTMLFNGLVLNACTTPGSHLFASSQSSTPSRSAFATVVAVTMRRRALPPTACVGSDDVSGTPCFDGIVKYVRGSESNCEQDSRKM